MKIVLAILGAIFLIAGAYLYVENQKLNKQIDSDVNKQVQIDGCIETAYKTYKDDWMTACIGFSGYYESCKLPAYISDSLDSRYNENVKLCLERYK